MLNLESYRSSTDYREILRILQKASSMQENFLWQTGPLGRKIIPIHHFEIDFVAREVVIYFDSKRYMVEEELPLYVKLDYRTSVFKATTYRRSQNSVHFAFPTELKTQELRSKPRHQFAPDKIQSISLKPSLNSLRKDAGHELTVRAFDISEDGIGLIVSEQNRSYLKNNRILWVTRLMDQVLEYPVLAEVVYINNDVDPKYQTKRLKELKVGIKLSGVFPTDLYQKFIQ